MSNRAALQAAVFRRLVNRDDVTTPDLDRWLNDGLLDLATQRFNLRSLEVGPFVVTPTVNVAKYPIPLDSDNQQLLGISYIMQIDTTRAQQRRLVPWPGSFEQYLQAITLRIPIPADAPIQFALYGNDFYLYPGPGADVTPNIHWEVYGYRRPFMGPNPDSVPNIEPEWHYAIELHALLHAFRELGDEERATAIAQEFQQWYAARDTARRIAKRFNPSEGGARPQPGYFDRRTGR